MGYNKTIPFIKIKGGNFDLFISSVSAKDSEGNHYKPLLLSDVNIKESIDLLGDNKLKISNINLALSNIKHLGKRISDDLDSYVINSEITIYFYNNVIKDNLVDLTDDLIVFKGKVSDYNFDDLKLNFDCESAINKLWTTTVPNPNLIADGGANIGDGVNVPDKFKNKPIPAVYGRVENSPVIPYVNDGYWNLAMDSKAVISQYWTGQDLPQLGVNDASLIKMKIDDNYLPLLYYVAGEETEFEDYFYRLENGLRNTWVLNDAYNNSIEAFEGIRVTILREINEDEVYVERQYLSITESSFANTSTPTALKLYNEQVHPYPNMANGFNDPEAIDLDIDDPHHVSFDVISHQDYNMPSYPDAGYWDGTLTKYRSTSKIPPYYHDNNPDTFIAFYSKDKAYDKSYAFIDLPLIPLNNQFKCETYIYIKAMTSSHDDGQAHTDQSFTGMFIRGASGDNPNHIPSFDRNYTNMTDTGLPLNYFNDLSDQEISGGWHIDGYIDSHGNSNNDAGSHNMYFFGKVGMHLATNNWQGAARIKYNLFDTSDKYMSIRVGKPKLEIHNVLNHYYFHYYDTIHLHEIGILQAITIPVEKQGEVEFYTNVMGRIVDPSTDEDSPWMSEGLYRNPALIMKHLLNTEFGYSDDFINLESFESAKVDTTNQYFDFSIVEGIKGNKLFEEMTRDIAYFPTFRKGKFDLVNIKDEYEESDYNDATTIPSKHILKYNFKRSDREKIYQKVIIKYWYDYGAENHLRQHQFGVDSVENNYYDEDYYKYYGIETNEFTGEYEQNILELENKYIRDTATAELCAKRIFYWLNNDHLTIDLTLPAYQYPDISIGSTIKFEELLDGVKPFNIDYRVLQSPAKTLRYPIFMVSNITKNSEQIKIKAIQLHGLHHNYNMYTESFYNFWLVNQPHSLNVLVNPETLDLEYVESIIYGCMDDNYVDYNPDANFSTGCSIPKVYGCTNVNFQEFNPDANIDDGSCTIPTPATETIVPHGRVSMLDSLNESFNPDTFLISGAHYPSIYYKDFLLTVDNAIINDGDLTHAISHLYSNVDTQNVNLDNPSYSLVITFANSSYKATLPDGTITEQAAILGYTDEDNNIDISGQDINNYLRIKKVEYMTFPTEDSKEWLMNNENEVVYGLTPESIILFDDSIDSFTTFGTWEGFSSDWMRIDNYSSGNDYQQYLQIKGRALSWHHPHTGFDSDTNDYLEWSPHLLYHEGHPNWHPRIRIKVHYDIVSPHEETIYSNSTLFTIPLSSAFSPETLGVVDNGDINFDGVTDINDVVMYLDYVLGNITLNEQQLLVADRNGDGEVNVIDVISVVDEILEGGS